MGNRFLLAVVLSLPLAGCGSENLLGPDDNEGPDGERSHAPEVANVRISPDVVHVDEEVTCAADAEDPDGGEPTLAYEWRNASRDSSLGSGPSLVLTPDDITPGETLRCQVTATDRGGHEGQGNAETVPICGFSDSASLEDFALEIRILFRPYKSEDLNPGDGGEPWDWDGTVPDWLLELADTLSDILGDLSDVIPNEDLMTAAAAAEALDLILEAIDEHAPDFMEPYVPPDPDLFPYRLDDEYYYPYWDGDEGIQWEDEYEVGLTVEHQDLYTIPLLAIDMEDLDITFDDSMGDWLDQGGLPLMLSSEYFEDGAYCTSTYYNSSDNAQETDVSYIPSSILWMEVDVW